MLVNEEMFCKIIQDTWASTLEHRVQIPELSEPSEFEALVVSVGISGAWAGEVQLRCPAPLARQIAGAIFQTDESTVGNAEILDALGEIIHIVAGNLKALLPQPVTASLPSQPNSASGCAIIPSRQMIFQLALKSNGYPFTMELFEHVPASVIDPPAAGLQPAEQP